MLPNLSWPDVHKQGLHKVLIYIQVLNGNLFYLIMLELNLKARGVLISIIGIISRFLLVGTSSNLNLSNNKFCKSRKALFINTDTQQWLTLYKIVLHFKFLLWYYTIEFFPLKFWRWYSETLLNKNPLYTKHDPIA